MENQQLEKNYESLESSVTSKKKGRRKIIFTFFGIITIIFLFMFFLPSILSFFIKDAPFIEDKDLQLSKVDIPVEENAYYDLMKIRDVIKYSEEIEDSIKYSEEIEDYLSGKKWDDEFVESVINDNKEALIYFDEAVKKPKYQEPASSDPKEFSSNSMRPTLAQFRQISRISCLKALYLSKQGKDLEALEEAIKSVEIGQKIQESQGDYIPYLVAVAMKSKGLNTIQKVLNSSELSSKIFIDYAQQFEEFKKNEEGLKKVFKLDYLVQSKDLDFLASGQGLEELSGEERVKMEKKLKNRFYFQPNKTKAISADDTRVLIDNVDEPCGLIKIDDRLFLPENEQSKIKLAIKLYFTENVVGKYLHDMVFPVKESYYRKKCEDDLLVSVTQLLFALKAYQIDNGKIPTSLNELVPKYISKIPEDPFNGEEIRYSESKKILYSVGEDLIDSGGSEGENWISMPDPTFKFIEEEKGVIETECEKWRKECTPEGGSRCGPCGCQNCCTGLISREVTHPWRTKNNEVICSEEMAAYICVKCGDGICGKGEDWCICSEDCKKPNPEDLELGW